MAKNPLVRCLALEAPPPDLGDNTADLDRLKKAVHEGLSGDEAGRPLVIPRARMAETAASFRRHGFRGTALLNMLPAAVEIVDFLPQTPSTVPVAAIDLGTTHLEGVLLDSASGKRLARAHGENSQIKYGDDILSRIHFADRNDIPGCGATGKDRPAGAATGLQILHECIITSINDLLTDLCGQAGIQRNGIRACCISGNTTMVHLLLNLSPHHICREPYIPMVNAPDPCAARELDIDIHQAAPLWILPSIGSYFGGDLISGILTSGLDGAQKPAMLIDVGTNAEVILGNRDWLIACAGAAGPALEGGVAGMGMRAGPGAIDRVRLDTDTWHLDYRTIDSAPPAGLCGSGLIDLVAELYLARIIDLRGKFRTDIEPESPQHAAFLRQHLLRDEGGGRFLVAPAEKAAHQHDVIVNQIDLDSLIRSKAAMYAILTTLVAQVDLEFTDIDTIFVAGAFGKHIDPQRAITLGMLPDLPLSTYRSLGNSSLRGAELILTDEAVRKRSMAIPGRITYIELNVNQEFMIRFSGSRFIPHTDPSLFPSVPFFQSA